MSSFEVATVGDNCIDRYLSPIGMATVGGNAVNVAVHLSRLGRRTAYFGAVGEDKEGHWTRACLTANDVNIEQLRSVVGRTAFTNLDVDPSGDRIITFEDFGVCRGYRPNGPEIEALQAARHIHLGWLNDGGALKHELATARLSMSQDLAVNAGAADLAIAFASAGASQERARMLLRQALDQGARIAVVTRGHLGSIASNGTDYAETGITQVEVVDTTGAGDTFIAAFIDAHLRGRSLSDCLVAGRDAAADTCRHLGGFPQKPIPITELSVAD
jgi:fructoselysine 6-kinase